MFGNEKKFGLRVVSAAGEPKSDISVCDSIEDAIETGNRLAQAHLQWRGVGDEVHGYHGQLHVYVIEPGKLVRTSSEFGWLFGIIPTLILGYSFQRDPKPNSTAQ